MGHGDSVTTDVLVKICKALNCDTSDIMEIELDENLTPQENAQKYYAQYKKAKIAYEYNLSRYNEAKEKLEYYKSIIFNIENALNFDILDEIKEELSEIGLTPKQKEKSKTEIEKLEFDGFDIYLGKNNKQNDYIISKIAQGDDLWFHGLNFPSAHLILKIKNTQKEPSPKVLEFCANLVKQNSKAKNSTKASIIFTKRKNLRKPPNTYLGYVTYKNETEIII